jgi:rhodanese-related sulfurtransferase
MGMVEEIEPDEVARRLSAGGAAPLLLDVREEDEVAAARIDPSVHIPMNEVPARLAEIPSEREIIVYCHHGSRSAMVAAFLEARGYPKVWNLSGGIDAWSKRVDPSIPRY